MIRKVEIAPASPLSEYSAIPEYQAAIEELKSRANDLRTRLKGHTLWLVNSTDKGGGVAEMLPKQIQIFRNLGIHTEWAVIQTQEEPFFHFTKRIHNMIHGMQKGSPEIREEELEAYEKVNRENAESFKKLIKRGDMLVVHDPQPMALGSMLKEDLGIATVWRSHIGTNKDNEHTKSVWKFLEKYSSNYDFGVFSAKEYVPYFFENSSFSLIHPAIDPLSYKNRSLTPSEIGSILSNAQLEKVGHPVLSPNYSSPARRLQGDGSFKEAYLPENFGFFYRPIVTQISRWDRLKGFQPLIEAFVLLKQRLAKKKKNMDSLQAKCIEISRLALAGPTPESIQDDPEGQEVLAELTSFYKSIAPEYQKDIGLFALPMDSLKNNALMVNALQSCSSIMVQNSLEEGFGLTVTEAMWKGKALLGTHAVGIREQIREKESEGRLLKNPEDTEEVAEALESMLGEKEPCLLYGQRAHKRVYEDFLVFKQMNKWLALLSNLLSS